MTVNSPQKALEGLIGSRCETKDLQDFPDLKPGERCSGRELWEAVDAYVASLLTELEAKAPKDYDTGDFVRDDISDLEHGGHRRGFNKANNRWRAAIAALRREYGL